MQTRYLGEGPEETRMYVYLDIRCSRFLTSLVMKAWRPTAAVSGGSGSMFLLYVGMDLCLDVAPKRTWTRPSSGAAATASRCTVLQESADMLSVLSTRVDERSISYTP